jgi:hypothetical protein
VHVQENLLRRRIGVLTVNGPLVESDKPLHTLATDVLRSWAENLPEPLDFRFLGGKGCGVFPGQAEDGEFSGC